MDQTPLDVQGLREDFELRCVTMERLQWHTLRGLLEQISSLNRLNNWNLHFVDNIRDTLSDALEHSVSADQRSMLEVEATVRAAADKAYRPTYSQLVADHPYPGSHKLVPADMVLLSEDECRLIADVFFCSIIRQRIQRSEKPLRPFVKVHDKITAAIDARKAARDG